MALYNGSSMNHTAWCIWLLPFPLTSSDFSRRWCFMRELSRIKNHKFMLPLNESQGQYGTTYPASSYLQGCTWTTYYQISIKLTTNSGRLFQPFLNNDDSVEFWVMSNVTKTISLSENGWPMRSKTSTLSSLVPLPLLGLFPFSVDRQLYRRRLRKRLYRSLMLAYFDRPI